MKNKIFWIIFFLLTASLVAQVRLPKLIGDGMVLQRDTQVNIWGWANAGEEVKVEFLNSTYNTSADSEGKWKIVIENLEAGGPYSMNISASNSITINNILVGDVWICSGQSNMELTMERASPIYEEEIANSSNPFIRQFEVPDRYNFNQPQEDVESGEWKQANPENIMQFSAVAYFFAKEIYDRYKIPVGLINASLGGSPASIDE
jgi:sialate O-acetylesterase